MVKDTEELALCCVEGGVCCPRELRNGEEMGFCGGAKWLGNVYVMAVHLVPVSGRW